MIDYGPFRFAAAPRTGSTWFLNAMNTVGFQGGSKATVHIPHKDEKCPTLRVSLVRHPCDWLRSYFTAIYPGNCGIPEVDTLLSIKADDFDTFINGYLWQHEGQVGRIFKAYHADSYIRTQDILYGTIDLLISVGVPLNKWDFLSPAPVNASVGPKHLLPRWKPHLRQLVCKKEEELMENFNFT